MRGHNDLLAALVGADIAYELVELRVRQVVFRLLDQQCPSSNDLRPFGLWKNGVSGSGSWLI
jgi:hypothetical protein